MDERLFLVLSPSSRVHIRLAQIPAKSPTKKANVCVHFPSLLGEGGGGIGPGIRGIGYAHSKIAPMVSPPAAVGRTNDSHRRRQMSPTLSLKSLPYLQLCGI
jgi:hypothetical protein